MTTSQHHMDGAVSGQRVGLPVERSRARVEAGALWSRQQVVDLSGLDEAVVAASLTEVALHADPLRRAQAARDSTLGIWLALNGLDLDAILPGLIALVPAGSH